MRSITIIMIRDLGCLYSTRFCFTQAGVSQTVVYIPTRKVNTALGYRDSFYNKQKTTVISGIKMGKYFD